MSNRNWVIPEQIESVPPELLDATDGQLIVAKLLYQRGFKTAQAIQQFLQPETKPPFKAQDFPQMDVAVERIRQAIEAQEAILVYGDFDVDGVCGTSILVDTLQKLEANFSYYVPSRHHEGHGMNTAALLKLVSSRQVKLVITTDTGTSNFNEVNLLKNFGVDTIITDHHELPENLPFALAILNPMLLEEGHPARGYSGSGMSFVLSTALLESYGQSNQSITDIYAIGTIVDMVSLKEDNRYWVQKGLQQIATRERIGLNAILEQANVAPEQPINNITVGFTLGPRINAIGRLTKADDAIELLTTNDKEKARQLASQLEQYNRQRQQMVETTTQEAVNQLEFTGGLDGQKVILMASKKWNPGIVGLVATRLTEKYQRPAMLGCIDEEQGLAKFSARSVPNVHLTQLLEPVSDIFAHWGGHSQAAGFALKIEDYSRFKQEAQAYFNLAIQDEALSCPLNIDLKLNFEQVTLGLYQQLQQLEPFGVENPEPMFLLEKVRLGAQRFMGDAQKHLKIILQPEDMTTSKNIEAIYWGWPVPGQTLPNTVLYDVVFKLSQNMYKGESKLQVIIEDIRQHNQHNQVVIPQAPSAKPIVKTPLPEKPKNNPLPFELLDFRNKIPEVQPLLLDWIKAQTGCVFCEGLQAQLPVPFDKLCTRQQQPFTENDPLLLWDIPPSMEALVRLLKTLAPIRVYIAPGKYPSVESASMPAETMLKGMRNLLLKLIKENDFQPLAISAPQLAQWMSTTEELVLSGLSIFQNLNWFEIFPESEAELVIQIPEEPTNQNPQAQLSIDALQQRMDFQTFAKQHQQVVAFKSWWLSSEASVLELHIGAALQLAVAQ